MEIINHLYEASNASVDIKLIVRGMFSLVPGIKDKSENIRAIGIVDRFLEHTRFFIFCNNGNEQCYISSADLMTRNIEHRIEVTCPIFDKSIKNEMKKIFDIQWNDNVKARKLEAPQVNEFVKQNKNRLQSQVEVYNYIRKVNERSSDN
jgi:polyphosphate kinase